MNGSRSTTKLVTALACGAGLRVLFFPDAAGIFSMALTIGLGVLVLSLLYVPWLRGFAWLRTLRDVGIVFGVNLVIVLVVGIVAIVTTGAEDAPKNVVAVAGIVSGTLGFLLVGVLARQDRVAHLARVAVAVWLLSGFQLLFSPQTWKPWLLAFFMTCASMWAGCGLSWLLKKPEPARPHEDGGKDCQPATAPYSEPASRSPQG